MVPNRTLTSHLASSCSETGINSNVLQHDETKLLKNLNNFVEDRGLKIRVSAVQFRPWAPPKLSAPKICEIAWFRPLRP
jgi:hypothetical protein